MDALTCAFAKGPAPVPSIAVPPDVVAPPAQPSRKRRRDEAAARLSAPDSDERLSRTLFFGNVPVSVSVQRLRRFVQRALRDAAAGGASAATREGADTIVETAPHADTPDVVSCRLRNVPIAKVAVAPGSGFRAMIRAAVAKGSLNPSRDTSNAFVVFSSLSAATRALALDGVLLEGKTLRVDRAGSVQRSGAIAVSVEGASPSTHFDYKRTVFVGNLHYDTQEESLRRAFGVVLGESAIEAVRIVRDKATLRGKGFAFVLLRNRSGVVAALGLHERVLEGMGPRPLRVTRCTENGVTRQ